MTFEIVRSMLAKQLKMDEEAISLETNFKDDLDADSLDLFQLLSEIEEKFDIIIDSDGTFETVEDLVDYIDTKKDNKKESQ